MLWLIESWSLETASISAKKRLIVESLSQWLFSLVCGLFFCWIENGEVAWMWWKDDSETSPWSSAAETLIQRFAEQDQFHLISPASNLINACFLSFSYIYLSQIYLPWVLQYLPHQVYSPCMGLFYSHLFAEWTIVWIMSLNSIKLFFHVPSLKLEGTSQLTQMCPMSC